MASSQVSGLWAPLGGVPEGPIRRSPEPRVMFSSSARQGGTDATAERVIATRSWPVPGLTPSIGCEAPDQSLVASGAVTAVSRSESNPGHSS